MRYEKLYNKFTLWANQNIVIKLLVATIMIALKLLLTSFVIWVTGFIQDTNELTLILLTIISSCIMD
jgi:hypothetical protein